MKVTYNSKIVTGLKFGELAPMAFYQLASIDPSDYDGGWKVGDLIVTDAGDSRGALRAINMRTCTHASSEWKNARYESFKPGEFFTVTI